MAKLYFKYSAMNAGKSTMAIQVAHNYSELNMTVLVWKPLIDSKGEDTITSRVGIERKADYLLKQDDSPIKILRNKLLENPDIRAIIIDEAQFLSEDQVNELYYITKKMNIPVLCYGLRCDFKMQLFPGSMRLLAIADEIEEIKNMCKCGKKATQNIRYDNGEITFDGLQVAIDGVKKTTYESVCGECYIDLYLENQKRKLERKIK